MNYQINLEREELEPGIPIEELFSSGTGKPAHPIYGIFLIACLDQSAKWEPRTGFFISQDGLFATAKHVLTDKYGNLLNSLVGIQILRNENQVVVRDIVNVKLHDKADVAIGYLKNAPAPQDILTSSNSAFELSRGTPAVGDKVATFAIPKPSRNELDDGKFEVLLAPRIIYGNVEEHHPTGRESVLLPGNCYRTSIDIQGGCSGGPVFYGEGEVFGINSSSYDSEERPPMGYVSSITEILNLTVNRQPGDTEYSINDLAEIGYISLDRVT